MQAALYASASREDHYPSWLGQVSEPSYRAEQGGKSKTYSMIGLIDRQHPASLVCHVLLLQNIDGWTDGMPCRDAGRQVPEREEFGHRIDGMRA